MDPTTLLAGCTITSVKDRVRANHTASTHQNTNKFSLPPTRLTMPQIAIQVPYQVSAGRERVVVGCSVEPTSSPGAKRRAAAANVEFAVVLFVTFRSRSHVGLPSARPYHPLPPPQLRPSRA